MDNNELFVMNWATAKKLCSQIAIAGTRVGYLGGLLTGLFVAGVGQLTIAQSILLGLGLVFTYLVLSTLSCAIAGYLFAIAQNDEY